MQDITKLRAWHLANELALAVVDALPERSSRRVPGLRSQAIRAATSVAANLAEGCARSTRREFLHFTEIALGSLNELDTHLLVACGSGMITQAAYMQLARTILLTRKMVIALARTLRRRIAEEEPAPAAAGGESAPS